MEEYEIKSSRDLCSMLNVCQLAMKHHIWKYENVTHLKILKANRRHILTSLMQLVARSLAKLMGYESKLRLSCLSFLTLCYCPIFSLFLYNDTLVKLLALTNTHFFWNKLVILVNCPQNWKLLSESKKNYYLKLSLVRVFWFFQNWITPASLV